MALSLESFADIVDREVLFTHGNALVSDGVAFGGPVWPLARLNEEGALGILAELVAEHAETAGGIAKALGDLMGGKSLGKISPQCLVLPMR